MEKWMEEQEIREEDEVKVCELFDQYVRQGRVEGEKIGERRGEERGIKKGERRGKTSCSGRRECNEFLPCNAGKGLRRSWNNAGEI